MKKKIASEKVKMLDNTGNNISTMSLDHFKSELLLNEPDAKPVKLQLSEKLAIQIEKKKTETLAEDELLQSDDNVLVRSKSTASVRIPLELEFSPMKFDDFFDAAKAESIKMLEARSSTTPSNVLDAGDDTQITTRTADMDQMDSRLFSTYTSMQSLSMSNGSFDADEPEIIDYQVRHESNLDAQLHNAASAFSLEDEETRRNSNIGSERNITESNANQMVMQIYSPLRISHVPIVLEDESSRVTDNPAPIVDDESKKKKKFK